MRFIRHRWIYCGVPLIVCLLAAVAGAVVLKSRRFEGGEYVMVSDVAKCYGLGGDTSREKKTARYRTSFAEWFLEDERREITLNGVQHWLSAPIYGSQDRLWISATDVLKTIDPILRQGRQSAPLNVRTIVLDPGHGGHDRGAQGRTGIEKTLTLDLAKRLQNHLAPTGLRIWITRTSDRFISLDGRPAYAKQKNADLFVSIHLNSAGIGSSAQGIETYSLSPAGAVSTSAPFRSWRSAQQEGSETGNRHDAQNIWLAHCIQKSLLRATGAPDRGVRRARFAVLCAAPCPAVLVECGFLSNAAEERKLLEPAYRDRLAKAMADGILSYRASVERP